MLIVPQVVNKFLASMGPESSQEPTVCLSSEVRTNTPYSFKIRSSTALYINYRPEDGEREEQFGKVKD
jgi:hypothetical protein